MMLTCTSNTMFHRSQKKNLLILYDAIGTLAESVGQALNQPTLIQILMPPIIERWNALPDDDVGLFPMLEVGDARAITSLILYTAFSQTQSLAAISCALGPGFQQFAAPVYERCIRLVQKTLTEVVAYESNPRAHEQPDRDFMIVGLDLLSGIVQALKEGAASLVAGTQPSVLEMLAYCVKVGWSCYSCVN